MTFINDRLCKDHLLWFATPLNKTLEKEHISQRPRPYGGGETLPPSQRRLPSQRLLASVKRERWLVEAEAPGDGTGSLIPLSV